MNPDFLWQEVHPKQWRNKISELIDSGFIYFDFLTGVDRENVNSESNCEVIAHLAQPDLSDSRMIFTQVKSQLASIADLAPASSWYERECAEMYGITFTGGDSRPLLRHDGLGRPPLRKSVVLAARVLTPWPGGAESEIKEDGRKMGNVSRRRQRPPGVPENWLKP